MKLSSYSFTDMWSLHA